MRKKIAIIKYLSLCFLLFSGLNAFSHENEKEKSSTEKNKTNKLSPSKTPLPAAVPIWSPEMLSNLVIPETPLGQEDVLVIDSAKTAFEQITRNGSWVNLLTENSSVKFPFGMLKKVPNYSTVYQLAFNSVSITKSGAVARVFGRMLLNGSQNSAIYFQGFVNLSRIGGAGSGNKLTLIGDQTVNNSVDWSFILNGEGSTSPTTMSFDCNGFTGLDINGSINLNKDKYKPITANGVTAKDEQLKSTISVTGLTKWEEIYVEKLQFNGYFTATSVPLLGGYAFRISEATLDMNDNKSPSGGDLGAYISKDNSKPSLWRGIAINKMEVSLPGYFYTGKKTSKVVGIKYGVIDDNGFSFSVDASNVFDYNTGSANGWDMSITKFNISVLKGELTGGAFSGKLILPIEDPGFNIKGIPFETTINDDGSIETEQGEGDIAYITMKPWYGYIHPENIELSMNIDLKRNILLPKVTLSGKFDFSMSGDNAPYIPTKKQEGREKKANFSAEDIEVEDMVLQTEGTLLTIGSMGTVRQITLGGFSAVVAVEYNSNSAPNNASDANTAEYACLHFDANLQLGGGKVNGGTTFDLYMKYDTTTKKWKYADYRISKVKVGYEGGKVKFKGEINLIKDKTYGMAYGGTITLTVLDKVEMGASVLFGINRDINNGQQYDYFNVDAMVKKVRYQVGKLTITGFSGGVTYRMDPITPDGVLPVSLSGISYKPNQQSFLRVRAGVYLEIGKEQLFTGWAGLEIVFNKNGGVNEVSLSGRAQIFSKPDVVIKKPEINPIKNGDDKSVSSKGSKSSKKKEDDKEDNEVEEGSPLIDKLARYSGGKEEAEGSSQGAIIGAEEAVTSTTTNKIETLFPANKYDLPAKFDSATMAKMKSRYVINKPIYDRAVVVFDSMANIGVTVSNTYYRLKESSRKWDTRFDTHPYVQFSKSHQAFSKLVDNTNAWKEICKRIKLPYMITPLQKDNSFTYENKYVIPTPATIEREARAAPGELPSLLLFKAENSNEYGVITVAKLLVPYYNDVFDYNMKKLDSTDRYEALERYWINEVGMRPYERASGDLMRTLGITKNNPDLRNAYIGLSTLAGSNYAKLRGSKSYDTAAVMGGTTVGDSLLTYEGMVKVNTTVYDLAVKERSARIKKDGGLTLSATELSAIDASDEANDKYAAFLKEANRVRAVKQQQTLYDDVVARAKLIMDINYTRNADLKKPLVNKLEILNTKIAQEGKSLSRGELLFNPSKEQMNYLEKNYARNKNFDTLGGLQILRNPVDMSVQIAIDMVIYDDLKKSQKSYYEKYVFTEMENRKKHVGVAVAMLEIADSALQSAAVATAATKTTTVSDKSSGVALPAYARPDGDPVIWGDFIAKMDIANNTFSFVLQAYVAMEAGGQSIVEGSGANFRAGLAELYISGSTFKLNVGTQEEPLGVTFLLPKVKHINAEGSFYLQVTNAQGDDGSNFSVKTGFGIGASFGFRASIGGFGAYAYLNGKFGMDLALKRFDNFICNGASSGGLYGWYGQGKVYASLNGAAGVIIAGQNYEILSGNIGLTLTVKGPWPLYMSGTVRFDYNVLGYRGNKEIPWEEGSKCDNIKF